MPYKDKEKQLKAQKEAMKRKRGSQKGSQKGSQGEGSHNDYSASQLSANGTFFRDGIEYVPASYVPGSKGRTYQFLPERPRYLTLSDGQVLDRAHQPQGNPIDDRMLRANDSAFAPFKKRKPMPEELKDKLVKI